MVVSLGSMSQQFHSSRNMNYLVVLFTLAAQTVATPLGYAYAPLPAHYIAPVPYPYPYPAAVVAAPGGVKAQYYTQDNAGRVSYGFADPTQTQSVIQDAEGNKVGSFSFINAEGKLVQANYIADTLGYRVVSNDLPTQGQTQPAQDSPEVAETKNRLYAEYEQSQNRRPQGTAQDQTATDISKMAGLASISHVVAPIPYAYAPAVAPVPYPPAVAPVPYIPHIPLTYSPYAHYGYPVHYPYPVVVTTQ